jgi:hypothetical protein
MRVIYTDQSIISLEESLDFAIEERQLPQEKASELKSRLFDRADSLALNPYKGQREEYLQHLKEEHRRIIEGNPFTMPPTKMLPGWNWSSLNRNGDQNTPMPSSPGKTTGRNSLIFLSIPWPYEGSSIRPISLKTSIQRSESTQKTRPLSLMIMQ